MRQTGLLGLCLAGTAFLSGCGEYSRREAEVDRALKSVSVVDQANLNELMLTVGAPDEAVAYFARGVQTDPARTDLRRGLAKSLVRANRAREAVPEWEKVIAAPESTAEDRVGLADALIRLNEWDRAATELNLIPPTHETYERYRLEAMVADYQKNWTKADSFYEIAAGLTTQPAGVYNNWGFSKLTRGDFPGAERLFTDALKFQPTLYTAKNNLVLARGAQRKYDLPVIPMTQTERAQLLYSLALTAIKRGDVTIGKGLLKDAVDTHPQYYEEAVRALEALDGAAAG